MISIHPTHKKFWDNQVEGYVFLMTENLESASDLSTLDKIDKEYYKNIKAVLKQHQFQGKKKQSFILSAPQKNTHIHFIFVGIGSLKDTWHFELENLRRAVGSAVLLLKKLAIETAVLALPNIKPFGISSAELVQNITIAAVMADYEFLTFKSTTKDKHWKGSLLIELDPKYTKPMVEAIKTGTIIGQATSLARNWADLPGNILTPTILASEAQALAKKHKLKCTVLGRTEALKLGMGGFCAVDAGSDQDGKFVILEYKTSTKNASTIALVGKGVCFDSGGISLKPSTAMEGMKFDMSGAAATLATMSIIAQLKPDINVIGITPLVENMPSGKAARQDDIITFMNGKTAEIKSTDAEGRLILADALCYAEKYYKPDMIIDLATLTGACIYAIGHFYAGMMTRNEKLAEQLIKYGLLTGDKVWRLPLEDDYKDAIKSDVADISNTGSSAYKAGTVTAGCFLEFFVEKTPWVHIDIAGAANEVPGVSYLGKGATGVGVRLLTELVMNYKKE